MRYLALIALALCVCTAAAVELPYCRLTVNMAGTIDQDEPVLKTVDGWYDEETHCLYPDKQDANANGAYDPARIVKVEKAARAPGRMPAYAGKAADDERAKKAKEDAKAAAAVKKAAH